MHTVESAREIEIVRSMEFHRFSLGYVENTCSTHNTQHTSAVDKERKKVKDKNVLQKQIFN